MKKMSETVVFFGSGPVAKASLAHLIECFDVEAVVTKPVTEKEMTEIAPKSRIYTVHNRRDLNQLISTKPFKSRMAIIVDFGIIVDHAVIDYFPLGIVNSHFSLLPEWRGADPISFAVLSGQEKTGVSLMLVVKRLDEGPLLAQSVIGIEPTMTTPRLTDALVDLSNKMLEEVLPLYAQQKLIPYEQPADEKPTYSRKLTKEDGIIDWHKPAIQLDREIRAFIQWPKSRTTLAGKDVIITKSRVLDIAGTPGAVRVLNKKIVVFCGKDALEIERLKPAGKKEMSGEAFLAGHQKLVK